MAAHERSWWIVRIAVLILCGHPVFGTAAENPSRVCDVAKTCKRPAGAPGASDVLMRSLRMHPAGEKDSHDTLQAIRDFHVTRLEWAYINDKPSIEKIEALGCLFGAAASAPSYLPPEDVSDWF